MNGACDAGPCRGNGNGGHLYGTDLPPQRKAGADRAPEDVLRRQRWPIPARSPPRPALQDRADRRGAADPRRRRRRLRLVQVLPRGAAGGLRRRGAVAPRRALRRPRPRSGSSTARSAPNADLGIPYPIFHVLPRVFGDLLPGPGGYARLRHPLGGGARAAGRLLEEDRRLPPHHPDLRHLPCGELPDQPGRGAGHRADGPVAHHERHGVPRFPGGGGQRPALVGRRDDAGDRAELRPRARRQADLPLPDHPDRQGPGAGAGGGLRLDPRA